jgi:ATP-binding protein involved in chromosome partitioning
MACVIGVVAGKGGVGKSTISVNLALALKKIGLKIGLIDADIYGPSLRKMMRCDRLPSQNPESSERIIPAESLGIKVVSMGFFVPEREAAVVRAPIANDIIGQFLHRVDWGELDYLIIDFPPGTGDIQLTLMQQGKLDGALIVTTPQELALLDVRKAVRMLIQLGVPILGVIENMSHFLGQYPFGKGGGAVLAAELSVPLLGEVPLDPLLCRCADEGISIFDVEEKSAVVAIFDQVAMQVLEMKREEEEIKDVYLLNEKFLSLSWKDGLERTYPLSFIQEHCPCVRCRSQKNKYEDVKASRIEIMGRYGVKLQFSVGCSFGIYPFSLLRRF